MFPFSKDFEPIQKQYQTCASIVQMTENDILMPLKCP